MQKPVVMIALACAALVGCEDPNKPLPDPAVSASAAKPAPMAAKPSATTALTAAGAAPSPAGSSIPAPPDVADPPADATKTSTGLASKVLEKGSGKDHP